MQRNKQQVFLSWRHGIDYIRFHLRRRFLSLHLFISYNASKAVVLVRYSQPRHNSLMENVKWICFFVKVENLSFKAAVVTRLQVKADIESVSFMLR